MSPGESLTRSRPRGLGQARGRGAARLLRRRKPLAQSRLHQERQDLLVPLRQLLLVSNPGNQAAIDADVGELAELIDDLLCRADERISAVTGDEMRLVAFQCLGIQSLVVQTEDLQEIAGGLPV